VDIRSIFSRLLALARNSPDPARTVPIREMWLYGNRAALAKVREGLAQAAQGDTHDLGSFAKYADNEID